MTPGLRGGRRTVAVLMCVPAFGAAGCAAPEGDDSGAPAVDVANPGYLDEPPVATLTVEDIAALVTSFLQMGTPSAPKICYAFDAYLAHGNENCPGSRNELVQIGNEGCSTPDGWTYAGIGWFFSRSSNEGGVRFAGMSHGGDYRVGSPDGDVMTGGGGIAYEFQDEGGKIELSVEIEGSFQDSLGEPWLAEGYSTLGVYTASGTHGALSSTFSGGVSVGGLYNLDFKDVLSGELTTCPWEPEGEIGVRDTRGYWYVWHHEADCDPCAPVTFEPTGEEIGEVCVEMGEYFASMFFAAVPT